MTPLHATSRGQIMLVECMMYLTLPNIVPFWLCFNTRSTAIQCLQFVYDPNFVLNIPIPCYIFITQMLFVLGVSTYNFMFYMIGRITAAVMTHILLWNCNNFVGIYLVF